MYVFSLTFSLTQWNLNSLLYSDTNSKESGDSITHQDSYPNRVLTWQVEKPCLNLSGRGWIASETRNSCLQWSVISCAMICHSRADDWTPEMSIGVPGCCALTWGASSRWGVESLPCRCTLYVGEWENALQGIFSQVYLQVGSLHPCLQIPLQVIFLGMPASMEGELEQWFPTPHFQAHPGKSLEERLLHMLNGVCVFNQGFPACRHIPQSPNFPHLLRTVPGGMCLGKSGEGCWSCWEFLCCAGLGSSNLRSPHPWEAGEHRQLHAAWALPP